MSDTVEYGGVQLDCINVGELRVKQPSGAEIVPYKGQRVWCYGYGRSVAEMAAVAAKIDEAPTMLDRVRVMAELIANECPKWDLIDYRTRQPYAAPSPEVVMTFPDDLLNFLVTRLVGKETEGEGTTGSGN
jgi:hypothetical protein